jgi:hypothetical protein
MTKANPLKAQKQAKNNGSARTTSVPIAPSTSNSKVQKRAARYTSSQIADLQIRVDSAYRTYSVIEKQYPPIQYESMKDLYHGCLSFNVECGNRDITNSMETIQVKLTDLILNNGLPRDPIIVYEYMSGEKIVKDGLQTLSSIIALMDGMISIPIDEKIMAEVLKVKLPARTDFSRCFMWLADFDQDEGSTGQGFLDLDRPGLSGENGQVGTRWKLWARSVDDRVMETNNHRHWTALYSRAREDGQLRRDDQHTEALYVNLKILEAMIKRTVVPLWTFKEEDGWTLDEVSAAVSSQMASRDPLVNAEVCMVLNTPAVKTLLEFSRRPNVKGMMDTYLERFRNSHFGVLLTASLLMKGCLIAPGSNATAYYTKSAAAALEIVTEDLDTLQFALLRLTAEIRKIPKSNQERIAMCIALYAKYQDITPEPVLEILTAKVTALKARNLEAAKSFLDTTDNLANSFRGLEVLLGFKDEFEKSTYAHDEENDEVIEIFDSDSD